MSRTDRPPGEELRHQQQSREEGPAKRQKNSGCAKSRIHGGTGKADYPGDWREYSDGGYDEDEDTQMHGHGCYEYGLQEQGYDDRDYGDGKGQQERGYGNRGNRQEHGLWGPRQQLQLPRLRL